MNDLMKLNLDQLPATQIGSDETFDELAKGGDYIGYLKLCSSDKYVKKNMIKNGNYGIPSSKEEIIDLGDSVDVLPLARRPKAIDLGDTSAIVTAYDETSDTFKDIVKRSSVTNSGCQWGTSFLVLERSTGRFLELFLGSASSRPEAKNIFPALPLTQADIDRGAAAGADVVGLQPHGPMPITLKSTIKENKKGMWYKPVVTKCSTPFTRLPKPEDVIKEIVKFLTPKTDGTEKAADERKARAR